MAQKIQKNYLCQTRLRILLQIVSTKYVLRYVLINTTTTPHSEEQNETI